MCGITGFLQRTAIVSADAMQPVAKAMASALRHRGPDDSGEWIDASAGVALGFRRLSIIDLSPAGHQPMESASGRYVIVFNGEVYNFERIRKELVDGNVAPEFRGHSDTEVMLAAIEAWGLPNAVRRFIGMFAFAVWDRKERLLHLVRDRVGVKPLYYGWSGNTFFFTSELKALRAHPAFQAEVDRDALALFMRHSYIPAPHSIYRGFSKLTPGTIATISATSLHRSEPEPYWSAIELAERAMNDRFAGSEKEAIDVTEGLLRDAVGLRMIADVPLGVFLSGGIDSSLVTAMMQVQSSRPVKTFSIGFHESDYNEATFAKDVARHLGTDHTELYLSAEQALGVIPSLPEIYDEPFADSSQIPTHLVSALAREHVTVSLSGDGGDELFGGYPRYMLGRTIWAGIAATPQWVRRPSAKLIQTVGRERWNRLFSLARPFLRGRQPSKPGDKMFKLAKVLDAGTAHHLYRDMVSFWNPPETLVLQSREPVNLLADPSNLRNPNFIERMMLADFLTYLPDDILVKVDRASMAVSLEAREPLLDHRLIELSFRLPFRYKVRRGVGKWILREVLDRHVPRRLIERPKSGFAIPIHTWLAGPLREWGDALLAPKRIESEGYLDAQIVSTTWREYLDEQRPWSSKLWNVLMFQAWLEHQKSGAPAAAAALVG